MGKAEKTKPEKMVLVPAALAERYPWLDMMKLNLKTQAEKKEKALRAGERVKTTADELARRYRGLAIARELVQTALGRIQEGLRNLWAQQGLTKAEGITISPAIELQLPQNQVLADLSPDIAALVIRHEPVFDVEAFMHLADLEKIPREIVKKHLCGKLEIQIKRVASATASP